MRSRHYIPPQDLRLMRARMMTAAVMRELQPLLTDDQRYDVRRELENLFYRKGVEVLTDEDRQRAGLPERGNLGWTDDELRALEALRVQALLKPSMNVFMPTCPRCRGDGHEGQEPCSQCEGKGFVL